MSTQTQIRKSLQVTQCQAYIARSGTITGVMLPHESVDFPWRDGATGKTYTNDGRASLKGPTDDDLIAEYWPAEEGDQLPEGRIVTLWQSELDELRETIELQSEQIRRLRAAIDRKNKIMTDLMEMARHELEEFGR